MVKNYKNAAHNHTIFLEVDDGLNDPVSSSISVEIVDTTVPVHLTVPVDIALNQTDLHEPLIGLQEVIAPYYWQLSTLPDSWQEVSICASGPAWLCSWLVGWFRIV